jgi:predicted DNA-binding transcriptional regulator AlpA
MHLSDPEVPRPEAASALAGPSLLLWTIDDLAAALAISRRTAERMLSAGKLPRPDLRIGRMPRWRPETIRQWIDDQSRKGVR